MARPDKTGAVAELVESFQESAGAVLTEYRGLSVKQLQELRRALGENANYAVVKNTLTKIAKLADLESREVLLGKLAGAMLASLSQAVYLLNAPLAQAARLAGALQAKAEEDPSILAGGAGTPAPAESAEAEAAPAAEEAAETTADAADTEEAPAPAESTEESTESTEG